MRRADRLFQIVQYLRNRYLTTARWLSEKLEMSERTIYRDIQDLMLFSGYLSKIVKKDSLNLIR